MFIIFVIVLLLLLCHVCYCDAMALAFVFGFIQIKLMVIDDDESNTLCMSHELNVMKTCQTFVNIFDKHRSFFEILSLAQYTENLRQRCHSRSQHTLNASLHDLVEMFHIRQMC